MTPTQLPQVRALSRQGVFLELTQDGTSAPGVVVRVRAELHITNDGPVETTYTLRSLANGVKVGSSQILPAKPGVTVLASFDDWFDRIEVLGDEDPKKQVMTMVRGVATYPFGLNINPRAPGIGTIDSTTPPFDYPSGAGGGLPLTFNSDDGTVTLPNGYFMYWNAPLSSSSSGP